MIKLSPDALTDVFTAQLADQYKPTHAQAMSHSVTYGDAQQISATYWLGTLDDDGNFVQNLFVPLVTLQFPNAHASTGEQILETHAATELLMGNLLGADQAPHPADPRDTVKALGKRAGDWKAQDIDAIAAFVHPRLRGRVV